MFVQIGFQIFLGVFVYPLVCFRKGIVENGNCSYDPDTHKCTICGATDPAHASVHVEVNVTKITGNCWSAM